jgi:hypothetical protein
VNSNLTRKDLKALKKASSGNKCGHQPDAPRFFAPPEKHALRPSVLRTSIAKLCGYFSNPKLFPLLNAANGSDRQQRSERREACVLLMSCILHYMDMVTYRVAIPGENGGMGLTMPYLANLTGLGERRAERAIHDLKKAGIITVHPICKKLENATYKGLAAIRAVSKHFFAALGLLDWLKHEQRKATERKIQREEKKRRKELAHIQMALNAAKPKAAAPVKRTGAMTSASDHLANIKERLKPPSG